MLNSDDNLSDVLLLNLFPLVSFSASISGVDGASTADPLVFVDLGILGGLNLIITVV